MKSTLLAVAVLAAYLLPGSHATPAQGVGASADLTGTVTDPTGAGVPKAKVTATDDRRTWFLPRVRPAPLKLQGQCGTRGFSNRDSCRRGLDRGANAGLRPSSQIVGNVVAGGSECRVSRRRDRERKPSEYPYADVHRRPADRPPRLPYLHIADAGRFQFHAASRRSGFSRQANAAKRSLLLRQ